MKNLESNNKIIDELSMIVGVNNKDINYLYYLLIKDGKYFDKYKKEDKINIPTNESTCLGLDDWLESFEEIIDE